MTLKPNLKTVLVFKMLNTKNESIKIHLIVKCIPVDFLLKFNFVCIFSSRRKRVDCTSAHVHNYFKDKSELI